MYAEIDSMRRFTSHEISIVGKKLRTREAEMEIVEKIIATLDEIIAAYYGTRASALSRIACR